VLSGALIARSFCLSCAAMAATDPQQPHQLTHIVLGDAPDAWRGAGFDVDEAGRFRLGRTHLTCLGTGASGFVGWALDGIAGALDGLSTADDGGQPAGTAPDELAQNELAQNELAQNELAHPNGISSIDHVVVRTGDCDRTIAAFRSAGLEVRGGRTTTSYGSPMRQTFFWAGDVIIELVGPDSDPDGAGEPTTDEPTSIFGLALVADDLDATAAFLGAAMRSPKDAVQRGRRIAGLRHRDLGIGLPIAVMSPHPA